MKAVARLLLTYFAGSPASRWLTASGLLLIMASLYAVLYLPRTEQMTAFAVPGVFVLFLGTFLMPLTLGRLAQSHAALILPGARVKLLISAILTVLLVALPAGLIAPLAFVAGMSADVSTLRVDAHLREYTLWLACKTYLMAGIAASWTYVLMWLVSRERNMVGFAKAMVVLLVLLLIPVGSAQFMEDPLLANLLQLAVLFAVFSACFLAWPRLVRWYGGLRHSHGRAGASAREFAGREIDLVLGNTRPWMFIVALLVPLAVSLRTGDGGAQAWLLYLSVAGMVAGANSERAPGRSRALWLRGDWSRAALFAAVEKSVWRHNGVVMLALLLFLFGVASAIEMSGAQLATALLLIIVGSSLSTYLGLCLTRGVRAPEAIAGVILMLATVLIAVRAGGTRASPGIVVAVLAALAAAALGLRHLAKRRWQNIDWSQCHRETPAELRAG